MVTERWTEDVRTAERLGHVPLGTLFPQKVRVLCGCGKALGEAVGRDGQLAKLLDRSGREVGRFYAPDPAHKPGPTDTPTTEHVIADGDWSRSRVVIPCGRKRRGRPCGQTITMRQLGPAFARAIEYEAAAIEMPGYALRWAHEV